MLARFWRWLSGADAFRELSDVEVEQLNETVARRLGRPVRSILVLQRSQDWLDTVARRLRLLAPGNTCRGLAFSSTVVVVRKCRPWLAHEFAHAYGADEATARTIEIEEAG